MNNSKSIIKQQQAYWLWFSCSLLIPFYFGLISLYFAFNHDYVIQDDARQHVVWLQRYIDPNLFPNDAIADYFISVAPLGYKSFYWLLAQFGIEPIILAKILPLFLGIIATYYLFLVSYSILPLPISAFWSCLFFNQLIWLNDDLVSATPRAFIYPLFAAFLYYFSKRSLLPCLLIMGLQGLFYPQILLVQLATIFISSIKFKNYYPRFNFTPQKLSFLISSLTITCLILLPYILIKSPFEPVIDSIQMKQMPEFNLGGRSQYFNGNFWSLWLTGSSGLNIPKFPAIVWLSFIFPWILLYQNSLIRLITRQIQLIYQVLASSLLMFLVAHLLLPRLHLPSRYTYHSLIFIMAIITGIIITFILEQILNRFKTNSRQSLKIKSFKVITIILLLTITIFPAIPSVFINWFQNWHRGTETEIYQYLAQRPKNIVIASLAAEADSIPAFTQRSVLVAREFAMAYHTKYYQEFQTKTIDLIQSQYSSDLTDIKNLIDKYQISYFLLEGDAFTNDYLLQKDWLINSSFREITQMAAAKVNKSQNFAFAKLIEPEKCVVLTSDNLYLLEAKCIQTQNVN